MKKTVYASIIGAGVLAASLAPTAAHAYVPPALEIPITCGQQTTTGPTNFTVYSGQEVTLVFSPTGCTTIYWWDEAPSNWNSSSGWLATQSTFTISAADVAAQIGLQFDIDKFSGDYEQIVLTDGGPAPEPSPEPKELAKTGVDAGAISVLSGVGAALLAGGALLVTRTLRSRDA
jgi:hypothetical protein